MEELYQEVTEREEEPISMPESLFRVETVLDVKTQQEASKTVRGKGLEYVSWFFIGLCALLVGYLLWQYFSAEVRDSSQLLMPIVAGFALLLSLHSKFFAPKKALKRWEQGLEKQFGTKAVHLTTEFFPMSLNQTVKETGEDLVEGYSCISQIKESENLFLLHCGKQQWFFVAKDGFVRGDRDSFRSFIESKIKGE